MHFDTILKTLFQASGLRLLELLTNAPVREWINVEIPSAQMRKLDLVAWLADGRLYHLELQSARAAEMAKRMLDYYLLLWKRYGVVPVQQLIYVGKRPLAMSTEILHDNLTFRSPIIDMRVLDSEVFLRSPAIEGTLLAILCRLTDKKVAVRRILARIAQLPASQRFNALSQLLLLSGLRSLEHVLEEETVHMPVIIDPMENRVIKRYFLQGKEEGRVEGEQEGARKEAAGLLTRLLERRFGRLPKAATRKLTTADLITLQDWSLRFLDAATLDVVLQAN